MAANVEGELLRHFLRSISPLRSEALRSLWSWIACSGVSAPANKSST